jgi:ATP-binding cassette subfamily C protein CydD
MIMIGKGAEIVTKRQYETLRLLSAHFLDSLQGLTTLKLFGQSKGQAKNIAKISEQYRDTTLSVLRVTFLSALALEMLATISTKVWISNPRSSCSSSRPNSTCPCAPSAQDSTRE